MKNRPSEPLLAHSTMEPPPQQAWRYHGSFRPATDAIQQRPLLWCMPHHQQSAFARFALAVEFLSARLTEPIIIHNLDPDLSLLVVFWLVSHLWWSAQWQPSAQFLLQCLPCGLGIVWGACHHCMSLMQTGEPKCNANIYIKTHPSISMQCPHVWSWFSLGPHDSPRGYPHTRGSYNNIAHQANLGGN